MSPFLKVKDSNGTLFTMPSETPHCILSMHYCTSYYEVEVQEYNHNDKGEEIYPTKTFFIPLNTDNWIDFIALQGEEMGELVTEQ